MTPGMHYGRRMLLHRRRLVSTLLYVRIGTDMLFAWNESKNRTNRNKHGISFEMASLVFADPWEISEVDRTVDGELRWQTVGLIEGISVVTVTHTREGHGDEIIRIITARKATPRERRNYEERRSKAASE